MKYHPPIPPNCEYFQSSEGGDTMNFIVGDEITWCLCHVKDYQRPIICAVAKDLWEKYVKVVTMNSSMPTMDIVSHVNRIIQEWRDWGDIKNEYHK